MNTSNTGRTSPYVPASLGRRSPSTSPSNSQNSSAKNSPRDGHPVDRYPEGGKHLAGHVSPDIAGMPLLAGKSALTPPSSPTGHSTSGSDSITPRNTTESTSRGTDMSHSLTSASAAAAASSSTTNLPPIERTATKLIVKLLDREIKTFEEANKKAEEAHTKYINAIGEWRKATETVSKTQNDLIDYAGNPELTEKINEQLTTAKSEESKANQQVKKTKLAAQKLRIEANEFKAFVTFRNTAKNQDLLGNGEKNELNNSYFTELFNFAPQSIRNKILSEIKKKVGEFEDINKRAKFLGERGANNTDALIRATKTSLNEMQYLQHTYELENANIDLKVAENIPGNLTEERPEDETAARQYDYKQHKIAAITDEVARLEKLLAEAIVGDEFKVTADNNVLSLRHLHQTAEDEIKDYNNRAKQLSANPNLKESARLAFINANTVSIDPSTAGFAEAENNKMSVIGRLLARFEQITVGNERNPSDGGETNLGSQVNGGNSDSQGKQLIRENRYISGLAEKNRNILPGARITVSTKKYQEECSKVLAQIAKSFAINPSSIDQSIRADNKKYAAFLLQEIDALEFDKKTEGQLTEDMFNNGQVTLKNFTDVREFLVRTKEGFHKYLTRTPGRNDYEYQVISNDNSHTTPYKRHGDGSVGITDPSNISAEHAKMLLSEVRIGHGLKFWNNFLNQGNSAIEFPISSTDNKFSAQSLANIIKAFSELKKEERTDDRYVLTIDQNLQKTLTDKNKGGGISNTEKQDLQAALTEIQTAHPQSHAAIQGFIASITANTPSKSADAAAGSTAPPAPTTAAGSDSRPAEGTAMTTAPRPRPGSRP